MKLPVVSNNGGSLCEQCVALCCRYFAFAIEKPDTKRDFEDLRWYMLHEDTLIFVEKGEWYIQINRPCRALLPDNRCGIYENRPTICREYKTDACDWHGTEYDYDHLFTEPEQIDAFAKEHLAQKRRRRRAVAQKRPARRTASTRVTSSRPVKRRRPRKGLGVPLRLLKSA